MKDLYELVELSEHVRNVGTAVMVILGLIFGYRKWSKQGIEYFTSGLQDEIIGIIAFGLLISLLQFLPVIARDFEESVRAFNPHH